MRIAIVTETFVPATDGICTRLAHFVVEFKRLGHDVIVISPDLGITEYKGVRVFPVESINVPLYGSRKWGLPSRKVQDILDVFQPDIVHAVNPASLAIAAIHYANKNNYPVIASYHTHLPEYSDHYHLGFLKPMLWDYLRYWHQKADMNITVSQTLADELIEKGIDIHGILPRGVDIDARHSKFFNQSLYDELTFNQSYKHLLIYIGRLAVEKDIDQLKAIFEERKDISLAIVGDGPDRERLETLFIDTPTTFLGFLHGDKLSQAFATGDAFIFPSTSETFGLVISEAMASGVPVIAAESKPTLEQITPLKTGITFQTQDKTSLINALTYLKHPLLMQQISLNARKEVEKYSWRQATFQLLDFYDQTISIASQITDDIYSTPY